MIKLPNPRLYELIPNECESKYRSKFAPVCPPRIYKGFLNAGYVPNTVLLLAHDVVANEYEYAELFEDPRWSNTNIIMDNSVVETGKAADLKMIKEAVDIACADIVVLPDTLGDGEATRNQIKEAYQDWKWTFKNQELMALVQGKDIRDWLITADTIKPYGLHWIGIPRCAEGLKDPKTDKVYDRTELVLMAEQFLNPHNIHLFGFSDSIWEDLDAAKYPTVKSIDSASPLRLTKDQSIFEDPGPRGNWWSKVEFDPYMVEICQQINSIIGE